MRFCETVPSAISGRNGEWNMSDKTTDASGATEATAPSERAHHAGDGGAVAGGTKRFSAKRKLAIVQRLLRGEGLETVSREENVPVHRLTAWRDKVLMGAESALKEHERDARDDEIARRAGPRWARSQWTTSCCTRRSTSWRAVALWPGGDRRHEPDAFDLQPPSLRDVSRLQDLGCAPGNGSYQGSLT